MSAKGAIAGRIQWGDGYNPEWMERFYEGTGRPTTESPAGRRSIWIKDVEKQVISTQRNAP
ncbi:MAG: hypothetical protein DHS20C16_25460 [Phycisphaerae bacterium]|nr:MAG: hypothetical protein DHS20C16_25460 [Phycisphaerae bacterium]